MREAKRIKYVSFRLTDEEYTEIERAAVGPGDDPNNWCRNLALTVSREGPLFWKNGTFDLHRTRYFALSDWARIQAAIQSKCSRGHSLDQVNDASRSKVR